MLGTPSGHPIWFVNVRDNQRTRIQALEAAGFADQSNVANDPWRKVFLERTPYALIPPGAPPAGITIRPLAGPSEVEAYVGLHRAAFGSTNMTHEWRNRVLRWPEYRADLDLVAVTDEGQLVGFCTGMKPTVGPWPATNRLGFRLPTASWSTARITAMPWRRRSTAFKANAGVKLACLHPGKLQSSKEHSHESNSCPNGYPQ